MMKNQYNKAFSPEWNRFLKGYWQKELPSKPGTYPVADRSGNDAGTIVVVLVKGKLQSVKDWEGWWWSEPQPWLNRPPRWNEDE